ncbi:MAG: FAD-dependent oxidoreductase [Xanthomonadales bacterium]|nr:FAD-dependent oxidoreductase [Xanthomonadales bacterium]
MASLQQQHIAVIGAGAFGGWTALSLARAGARVTLLDQRDPGNALSSSGGASRVIRHVYERRHHVAMARRALELWLEADQVWGQQLFHRKGVLFMSGQGDMLARAAEHMDQLDVEYERLDGSELARRYPQMRCEGFDDAIFEPATGYLDAWRACTVVRDAFVREGGNYRQERAEPGLMRNSELQGLTMADGSPLDADQFVFACGPWLPNLFPAALRGVLSVTRQSEFFFRTPREQMQALNHDLPVWAALGESFWYGIPGADGLFKLADDRHGAEVDPETQSREPGEAALEAARAYMGHRFPGMRGAEYAGARVCQYTVSRDEDFILDRVPGAENAWLMGAGSGHGFKHGPAMGELAAGCILGASAPPAHFSLDRFVKAPGRT